jgi:hypothetical protein
MTTATPPLPAGFTLDTPGVPALPPGFTLDTAPSSTPAPPPGFTVDSPQTVGGAVDALSRGVDAGVADIGGLPIDTMRNILELGKAGAGFVYHEATGNDIPNVLLPATTPDVGSSAWIKSKMSSLAGADVSQVGQPTTVNRLIHAGAEAIPSAEMGNEAAPLRAAASGFAAGVGQQQAANMGAGSVGSTAAGIAAAALTHTLSHPTEPPTQRPPGTTTTADSQAAAAAQTEAAKATPPPAGFTVDPTPQVAPDFTAAPTAEEAAREQTLRDAGFAGKDVRISALTGDTSAAGTDFQTSKVNNAPGEVLNTAIQGERTGLQDFAGQLRDMSGGTSGLTAADLYNRGQAIAAPIEQLSDHFDSAIDSAYKAANAKAGGVPIDMPTTSDFLTNQKAEFLGTVEGKQLSEGVQARMRDLGLMDQSGNVQSGTVQQAERLKQYLNNQWTPRTSSLIGQLKGAIDEDVTRAAGSDIYQQARQTRALRATLLDDPTGIAKLAAPDDRLGINRAVPLEKIPDYVTSLPQDQFSHIVNTLRNVPPEIQPAAANALNEIRAHFANQVEAKGNSTQGMWNARGVDDYLRANGARMAHVFSPEELRQFKTLQDAGNILKMDRTYPGAEAQRYNLAARGVNLVGKGVHAASTAVGAHAGPAGALAGHLLGSVAAGPAEKFAESIAVGQAKKRLRRL